MKSMTGYGKAEYKDDKYSLTCEIKTVNNRFLDLNSKYPRFFISLDDVIRRAVQSNLKRGKADLYISFENHDEDSKVFEVDVSLASAYLKASKQLGETFPDVENDVSIQTVLKYPDVVKQVQSDLNVEEFAPILANTISSACENLNKMREFEGKKLKHDLLSRVALIEQIVEKIKTRAPKVSEDYKLRLFERLKKALEGTDIDEARILQETAIFADKCNIDEEITRLTSHISQFRKICDSTDEIGKKLDFLVQEFNREANTVCSKSNDIEITESALSLKCEIEKIREQIQNVE